MNKYFDLKMVMSVAAGIIVAGLVAHVVAWGSMMAMGGGQWGGRHMMNRDGMMNRDQYQQPYSDTQQNAYPVDDAQLPLDAAQPVQE